MLNHIIVMGRLTRDPELRYTDSQIPVAGFTVAVDRDRAPEGQEKETDFIDCVAWRKTGEFVSKYFTKGSMIVVSGRLQIRNWTDKDGGKRRTAEIVAENCYFGDSKKDQQGGQQGGYNAPQGGYTAPQSAPQGGYNGPQTAAAYPQYPQSYPQYNQQGFGGYQQQGYQGQGFRPPQVPYAPIEGDDPNLPF